MLESVAIHPGYPAPALHLLFGRPRDVAMPRTRATSPADRWEDVRSYESSALTCVEVAICAVDARLEGGPRAGHEPGPGTNAQARAIAQIDALFRDAVITAGDAARRKQRMLMLGDVCVRLNTLIDLFDDGYLSVEELGERKSALSARLSVALVPSLAD